LGKSNGDGEAQPPDFSSSPLVRQSLTALGSGKPLMRNDG
jgi:hypothetical protein